MKLTAAALACLIALSWLTPSLAHARDHDDKDKAVDSPQSQHRRVVSALISLSTPDRLEDTAWWPTKGAALRGEYAGTPECAKCHFAKVASQLLTEMARASTRPSDPALLGGQALLTFRQPPFSYEMVRSGDQLIESVSDGLSSISRPLLFAFGKGVIGHTFIYQANDNLFESRLSYYSALGGLDLTTGHLPSAPPDLEQSLGRLLEPEEAHKCFGCHTTASTTANHFDPNQSLTGVACEACHGPGSKHVQAMKTGQIERGKKAILNPGRLDPASLVDFCGACHRTFEDVVQMSVRGVATVRFQPFRLEESRCWTRSNAQLTCVACHNPHESLVHDAASYDHVCLRCHSPSSSNSSEKVRPIACSVGKVDCVSCHMPKIEITGMHHAFTDHWIRITKNDMPYPN